MKTFIGIDLGSTTTKAVLLDEDARVILGRGITNSRSNYDTATRWQNSKPMVDARSHPVPPASFGAKADVPELAGKPRRVPDPRLNLAFRCEQFLEQLNDLEQHLRRAGDGRPVCRPGSRRSGDVLSSSVQHELRGEAPACLPPAHERKSDFFRDIAGSRYLTVAEEVAQGGGRLL